MKVNVYTKEDMVKNVELNLEVGEYFVIQRALCLYAGNMEATLPDRLLAVAMTEDMNNKEQIELDEFA